MRLDTIVGYAAMFDRVFVNREPQRREMFHRGCFSAALSGPIVLGVNHAVCLCRSGGGIDPALVLASTAAGTLQLVEDDYGLRFAAQVRSDACVSYGDGPLLNIHAAIRTGQCRGVSVHGHGGDRLVGPHVPADLFVWASLRLIELSLVLPPALGAGSPGTWVTLTEAEAIHVSG